MINPQITLRNLRIIFALIEATIAGKIIEDMSNRSANFQDRVSIGGVIRNAVVFNFRNWRGGTMNADSLIETVERLFTLLHERHSDYVLVGGIALLQYIEGRNTEDIDLIMALSSLEKIPEIEISEMNEDFARGDFDGLQIDILLTRNKLFDRVRRDYTVRQNFAERDIPCATVEGLLLLKMYALPSLYRQGNFARVGIYENDMATLINYYHPQLEPLLVELAEHLSETDIVAVREIIAEIQQRIERFDRSNESRP